MWHVPVGDENGDQVNRLQLHKCPYCEREYGSSSLPIHVKRCRSLMDIEQEKNENTLGKKKSNIPKLSTL